MFVSSEDYKNYELVLSSSNPKKVLVYEANDKDVLIPSFVRVIKSMPNPGKKVTVEVAENGYIIKQDSSSRIATGDWGNRLDDALEFYLNKDVEEERDLTESELEDPDLTTYTLKMNTAYKSTQKREE